MCEPTKPLAPVRSMRAMLRWYPVPGGRSPHSDPVHFRGGRVYNVSRLRKFIENNAE